MNIKRKKQIAELASKINELHMLLQAIMDEEQSVYDSIPESLQQAGQGQQSEASIELIEEAIDGLQTALDHLYEIDNLSK